MAYILKFILSPFRGARNAWSWAMSAPARRRAVAYRVKVASDDSELP